MHGKVTYLLWALYNNAQNSSKAKATAITATKAPDSAIFLRRNWYFLGAVHDLSPPPLLNIVVIDNADAIIALDKQR